MKRWIRVLGCLIGLLIAARASTAASLFDKKDYAARRSRLMEKIPDGVAVFLGAVPPAGDGDFRQGHDFSYFTGVPIPNAYLDHRRRPEREPPVLHHRREAADSEGIDLDLIKNPLEYTGIEKVLTAEQFGTTLTALSHRTRVFYTMFKPEELGARTPTSNSTPYRGA